MAAALRWFLVNGFAATTDCAVDTNSPPVLAEIGNKSVVEGTLTTATGTDPDIPAQTLTFSLDAGAPSGANISSAGVFTWTPSESLGGTAANITIRVTDNGTPSMSASETITITVVDTNTAPLLTLPANQTIAELATLNVNASASDVDVPAVLKRPGRTAAHFAKCASCPRRCRFTLPSGAPAAPSPTAPACKSSHFWSSNPARRAPPWARA